VPGQFAITVAGGIGVGLGVSVGVAVSAGTPVGPVGVGVEAGGAPSDIARVL